MLQRSNLDHSTTKIPKIIIIIILWQNYHYQRFVSVDKNQPLFNHSNINIFVTNVVSTTICDKRQYKQKIKQKTKNILKG